MKFDNTYWHSMDRQAAQNIGIPPSQLGISTPPMKDQLQSLKTRIFQGAQQVELGFLGSGKGSMTQGATTPGMYGKAEREAMKQLAKVNKVKLSTHAQPDARTSGLVGGREMFSEETRERAIDEIKRSVDFAADVAEGGGVTFHAAEFPRPVSEIPFEKEFAAYPKEAEEAVIYLVDKKTGNVITPIKKDQVIETPEYKVDPETGEKEFMWDPEKKQYKLKKRDYKFFGEEAKKWNEAHKEEIEKDPNEEKTAAMMMYTALRKMSADYNRAYGEGFGDKAEKAVQERKKIKEAVDFYESLEKTAPEEARESFKRQFERGVGDLVPVEKELPSEFLRRVLTITDRGIRHDIDMSVSQIQQAAEMEKEIKNAQPMERYAIKKSADSMARLGIYSMDKTRTMKLPEPVFIAPENVDIRGPGYGGYGSHPQELKELILKSREKMVDMLVHDRKMSKSQAEKAAADHIKATFDVGHAYTWKKYFKGDKKDFNKWLFKQVDDLNKSGVIGKVHLSDNFGYYDEHVTPGEGDVPIKEFVQRMEKAGWKEPMVVEPAHQDYQAWTGAMRNLQSPVYKIDLTSKRWTDIQGSYFGRTHSPSYLVGEGVVPSQDWTLWSGVPLE